MTTVRARRDPVRTGPRRLLAAALAAGVLAPVLLTGCAQPMDPIERLGRKAAQKVRHAHRAPTAVPAVGTGNAGSASGTSSAGGVSGAGEPGKRKPGADFGRMPAHTVPLTARATPGQAPAAHVKHPAPTRDAYRRWGLTAPLAPAPRPPAHLAPRSARGPYALPPVVDHVRTKAPVVFLTFDDAAGRDPRLADLVRDLRLPVSVFVTGQVAGPGRDHLGTLRRLGAGVQNHTLDDRSLPALAYAEQHAEICGQQDRLQGRFGTRPRLLRPPSDAYDQDTLRAAATCGVDAVVLGRAAGTGDRLRPGDIVLARAGRPGTTLTDTTARMLRRIQAQGFTVGRLEDYV
ncbi:polysaccharide deacetylase family protein [Streptomyces antnestii]|nr:polysaccharide deacetylase family protein [Streptomyces sp. San01]